MNRFLIFFGKASAAIQGLPGSFGKLDRLMMKFSDDMKFLGNPIRKEILDIKRDSPKADQSGDLKVFIMGRKPGSNINKYECSKCISSSQQDYEYKGCSRYWRA